jgi:hypothetical protein
MNRPFVCKTNAESGTLLKNRKTERRPSLLKINAEY